MFTNLLKGPRESLETEGHTGIEAQCMNLQKRLSINSDAINFYHTGTEPYFAKFFQTYFGTYTFFILFSYLFAEFQSSTVSECFLNVKRR